MCTKQTENKRSNLRNDIQESKTNKFHSTKQTTKSQIDQSPSKQRKDSKASNGLCDLSPKQDQTNFE